MFGFKYIVLKGVDGAYRIFSKQFEVLWNKTQLKPPIDLLVLMNELG